MENSSQKPNADKIASGKKKFKALKEAREKEKHKDDLPASFTDEKSQIPSYFQGNPAPQYAASFFDHFQGPLQAFVSPQNNTEAQPPQQNETDALTYEDSNFPPLQSYFANNTPLSDENIAVKPFEQIQNVQQPIENELEYHKQTINVLVSEKSELSHALAQKNALLEQKTSEILEVKGTLSSCLAKINELEHHVSFLTQENTQNLDFGSKNKVEYEKICRDYQKLRQDNEDLSQDVSEVRQKLKSASETNNNLQKAINDLNSQLSLANLKIQQLSTEESLQNGAKFENLVHERSVFESKIQELGQKLENLSREKEESDLHYQQYAQQLNLQITSLGSKIVALEEENKHLKAEEISRLKIISQLEKQLSSLQNIQLTQKPQKDNDDFRKELESSLEQIRNLQIENNDISEKFNSLFTEKNEIENEYEHNKVALRDLETLVEELRINQPDSAQLLATMESDKVAAARAISQNNDIKKQLEGMSETLHKVTSDNVALTEKVTQSDSTNAILMEKLQKTEISLQHLADAIEIKDQELTHLRDTIVGYQKHEMHHDQLEDRLRHYEAQQNGGQSLQEELQESKNTINKLTQQLNALKVNNDKIEQPKSDITELLHVLKQLDMAAILKNIQDGDYMPLMSKFQENETRELINKLTAIDLDSIIINELEATQNGGISAAGIRHNLKTEVDNSLSPQKVIETINTTVNDNIIPQNDHNSCQNDYSCQNDHKNELTPQNDHDHNLKTDSNDNQPLTSDKAVQMMQTKFLRLMDDVANLTDEKQRLEHLVLQLQHETETIDEYVALYQHQRSVLNQKALEKDVQLNQLAEDRKQMKANIEELNQLVGTLINGRHLEIDECKEAGLSNGGGNDLEPKVKSDVTVEKIKLLLGEIKTSNLVQPGVNLQNCHCCYGKLVTV